MNWLPTNCTKNCSGIKGLKDNLVLWCLGVQIAVVIAAVDSKQAVVCSKPVPVPTLYVILN